MGLTFSRAILILWKEEGQVHFKTFARDFSSKTGKNDYKLSGGRTEAMDLVRTLLNRISMEDIAILEPTEKSGETTCFIVLDK